MIINHDKREINNKEVIDSLTKTIKQFGSCFFKILNRDLGQKIIEASICYYIKNFGPSVVLIIDKEDEERCINIFKYFLSMSPVNFDSDNSEHIIKLLKDGIILEKDNISDYSKDQFLFFKENEGGKELLN